MKQCKKYCIGMLLLVTLTVFTACGRADNGAVTDNNGAATDNNGTATDGNTGNGTDTSDILFDTDGDGVYDHTDVDGDGLLEEIGNDTNDVIDDLVNDVTGNDTMVDGNADGNANGDGTGTGTVENGTGKDLP